MVSFVCDVCQETLKKPKLDNHKSRCHQAIFSCIDCFKTFSGTDYRNHTSCITEVEKYHKGKNSKLNTFLNPKSESFLSVNNATASVTASGTSTVTKDQQKDQQKEDQKEMDQKDNDQKARDILIKALKDKPRSYHKIAKKLAKKGNDLGKILSKASFYIQNNEIKLQL